MIDWHTHILPGMDDGSRDVAESLSMMNMQALQGVDTVIATPHFYANDEMPDSFLERRKKSFELLKANWPDGSPEIRLGAEVRYYQGISRMADLKTLRIEGSKLLLLEMPMEVWTEYTVRELIEMSCGSTRIILAHMERYFYMQKQAVRERIFDSDILMQMNAGFFAAFATRHRALSLLREGRIHFVGSDCHNTTTRPPQIGRAFDVIRKRLGDDYLSQMNEYGHTVLGTISK